MTTGPAHGGPPREQRMAAQRGRRVAFGLAPHTDNFVVDTLVGTPSQLSVRAEQKLGALNSLRKLLAAHRRALDAILRHSRGRMSVFGEVYDLLDFENARGIWKTMRVRSTNLGGER